MPSCCDLKGYLQHGGDACRGAAPFVAITFEGGLLCMLRNPVDSSRTRPRRLLRRGAAVRSVATAFNHPSLKGRGRETKTGHSGLWFPRTMVDPGPFDTRGRGTEESIIQGGETSSFWDAETGTKRTVIDGGVGPRRIQRTICVLQDAPLEALQRAMGAAQTGCSIVTNWPFMKTCCGWYMTCAPGLGP